MQKGNTQLSDIAIGTITGTTPSFTADLQLVGN